MSAVAPEDMAFLSEVVRARSGMRLTPDKGYLIDSRLGPLARREELDGVPALIAAMRALPDERLRWAVTDALTANETCFFRDKALFEALKNDVLPALAATRPGGALRVWSAACSTGQEPYSLAMLAAELSAAGIRLDICASDISERCLEKARAGVYTQFEVQRGLPIACLVRWFDKVDETWRVKPELRGAVRWRRFNLLDDMLSLGRFDVVLCRNVLDDFDDETRRRVLRSLARSIPDDGCLMLGLGESLDGLSDMFEAAPGGRGLYRRRLERRAA
jgi:chemotaxis protein methyltransferase CheR